MASTNGRPPASWLQTGRMTSACSRANRPSPIRPVAAPTPAMRQRVARPTTDGSALVMTSSTPRGTASRQRLREPYALVRETEVPVERVSCGVVVAAGDLETRNTTSDEVRFGRLNKGTPRPAAALARRDRDGGNPAHRRRAVRYGCFVQAREANDRRADDRHEDARAWIRGEHCGQACAQGGLIRGIAQRVEQWQQGGGVGVAGVAHDHADVHGQPMRSASFRPYHIPAPKPTMLRLNAVMMPTCAPSPHPPAL